MVVSVSPERSYVHAVLISQGAQVSASTEVLVEHAALRMLTDLAVSTHKGQPPVWSGHNVISSQ